MPLLEYPDRADFRPLILEIAPLLFLRRLSADRRAHDRTAAQFHSEFVPHPGGVGSGSHPRMSGRERLPGGAPALVTISRAASPRCD